MRPRIMDSRIGVDYSVRLGIPQEGASTKRIFFSHRWNLVPKDKKAYAKGKLTQPVRSYPFLFGQYFPRVMEATHP